MVGGVRYGGAPSLLPRSDVRGQQRSELLGNEADPLRRDERRARVLRVGHAVVALAGAGAVLAEQVAAVVAQAAFAAVRLVGHRSVLLGSGVLQRLRGVCNRAVLGEQLLQRGEHVGADEHAAAGLDDPPAGRDGGRGEAGAVDGVGVEGDGLLGHRSVLLGVGGRVLAEGGGEGVVVGGVDVGGVDALAAGAADLDGHGGLPGGGCAGEWSGGGEAVVVVEDGHRRRGDVEQAGEPVLGGDPVDVRPPPRVVVGFGGERVERPGVPGELRTDVVRPHPVAVGRAHVGDTGDGDLQGSHWSSPWWVVASWVPIVASRSDTGPHTLPMIAPHGVQYRAVRPWAFVMLYRSWLATGTMRATVCR